MEDYLPGDPATRVFGKPEEKPARIHADPPPRKVTAKTITADIKVRIDEIKPQIKELENLKQELVALEKVHTALTKGK